MESYAEADGAGDARFSSMMHSVFMTEQKSMMVLNCCAPSLTIEWPRSPVELDFCVSLA